MECAAAALVSRCTYLGCDNIMQEHFYTPGLLVKQNGRPTKKARSIAKKVYPSVGKFAKLAAGSNHIIKEAKYLEKVRPAVNNKAHPSFGKPQKCDTKCIEGAAKLCADRASLEDKTDCVMEDIRAMQKMMQNCSLGSNGQVDDTEFPAEIPYDSDSDPSRIEILSEFQGKSENNVPQKWWAALDCMLWAMEVSDWLPDLLQENPQNPQIFYDAVKFSCSLHWNKVVRILKNQTHWNGVPINQFVDVTKLVANWSELNLYDECDGNVRIKTKIYAICAETLKDNFKAAVTVAWMVQLTLLDCYYYNPPRLWTRDEISNIMNSAHHLEWKVCC